MRINACSTCCQVAFASKCNTRIPTRIQQRVCWHKRWKFQRLYLGRGLAVAALTEECSSSGTDGRQASSGGKGGCVASGGGAGGGSDGLGGSGLGRGSGASLGRSLDGCKDGEITRKRSVQCTARVVVAAYRTINSRPDNRTRKHWQAGTTGR